MKILLIAFLFNVVQTQGNPPGDKSFLSFCEEMNGNHQKWEDTGVDEGERCAITLKGAYNPETAPFKCREIIPFRIISIKEVSKYRFECLAESTTSCKDGWIQQYGYCVQLTQKKMTKSEARTHCAGLKDNNGKSFGAKIAGFHQEEMAENWRWEFDGKAWQIWVDASEDVTENLIYNRGPELMFAIVTHNYGVPAGSFVRVPSKTRAFPLCEYKPPITRHSSNALIKRYSEIYFPAVVAGGTVYVRSSSSFQREEKDKNAMNAHCTNVMKPFFRTLHAQAAVPTKDFVNELGKTKGTNIIRFSAHSQDANRDNRISSTCTVSEGKNYGTDLMTTSGDQLFFSVVKDRDVWRDGQPKEDCDGGTWSSSLVQSREKHGLESMSDARYAPIYCQTLTETQEYGSCPDGYKTFERTKTNGQRWCHKVMIGEKPVYWDEGQKQCREDGAELDGWSDDEELAFIDEMLTEAVEKNPGKISSDANIWMGGRRREQCKGYKDANGREGHDPDDNHPCGKPRVFEWVNGVAPNTGKNLNHWMGVDEPNMMGDEQCLELLKGTQRRWSNKDGSKHTNDLSCAKLNWFMCGKEAPIVKTMLAEFSA